MLKKRLIGVITVRSNLAVQSFHFGKYLPIGKPEILAENLSRWGADEILLLDIDRSREKTGPNFELLKKVGKLGLSTPISYGGGIQNASQAAEVIRSGAERVCLDTLLHENPLEVHRISAQVGAQAVIASLPLSLCNGTLRWFAFCSNSFSNIENLRPLFVERVISEALIIDYTHEGYANSFRKELLESFPFSQVPLILFGGISTSEQIQELLSHPSSIGVAVGNFLNYTEHALPLLKEAVALSCLRPAWYEGPVGGYRSEKEALL